MPRVARAPVHGALDGRHPSGGAARPRVRAREEGVPQLVQHAVAHVGEDLRALAEHLFECERREVEGKAHLHDERATLHTRRQYLLASQRRQQHFTLMLVLREPGQLRSPVDHSQLHLHHGRGCAICVMERLLPFRRGAHETVFHAARDAVGILVPEGRRQLGASEATVDGASHHALGELEHARVDRVDGGCVKVAEAHFGEAPLEKWDTRERAKHQVVLFVHRSRVEPPTN
mmetsp:Transcript_43303/g.127393  ORF Transcript_43303/g.127393 Transcript_43303/m.127393 type:complete len:232 (-) Transcript_43303:407-1102(-)